MAGSKKIKMALAATAALRSHRIFLRALATSTPLHITSRSNIPVGRISTRVSDAKAKSRPRREQRTATPPSKRNVLPSFLSRGVVALVGRPNVGKSTLFNRLVGRRLALVDATPGTTRDRKSGQGSIADLHFDVLDTPGLDDAECDASVSESELQASMTAQTKSAVVSADVILFMV
jgi:ribosome biogenesis GTPase A